jgi:hypothetical protein
MQGSIETRKQLRRKQLHDRSIPGTKRTNPPVIRADWQHSYGMVLFSRTSFVIFRKHLETFNGLIWVKFWLGEWASFVWVEDCER